MHSELQQLEDRWGLAIQSASFGVWDLDLPSQTVHYPPQWKALLGYEGTDTRDSTQTWRDRVHPEDLQRMLGLLTDHLAGRSPSYEAEFRLRAVDGSYRTVLSRGRVVERDAQGAPVRAVGTLVDHTDREEARRLRLELDRAEAASKAQTAFISRMSHELRTPLNAVLGCAQILARRIGNADVELLRQHVAHIEHAGWRLLRMVDDVLDLAQIESGALRVEKRPVALAPLVRAAVAAVAPVALRSAVQLVAGELPSDARVQADAGRLQQSIENLLGNAVQYNRPDGSVRIAVERSAHEWRLKVTDDGLGIPAAELPHLFEPFRRLGRPASAVEGIGIGLALTRSMVDLMGGRLSVQSDEGVGSCFEIALAAA